MPLCRRRSSAFHPMSGIELLGEAWDAITASPEDVALPEWQRRVRGLPPHRTMNGPYRLSAGPSPHSPPRLSA